MSSKFSTEITLIDEQDPTVNLQITCTQSPLGGKRFTASIGRSYIAEGDNIARTGWFSAKHFAAVRRLLDKAEGKLVELEEQGRLEREAYLKRLQETRGQIKNA